MDLLQLQERLTKVTALKEFVDLEMFRDDFLNSQLDGFDQYVQFKADNYYSTTLYRTDKFEIRLLCWKPSQETPRHPHPQNGCLMKILEGKLIEEKFINNSIIKTVYKKGEVGYIKASESHILKNLDTDSVSLHIRFYAIRAGRNASFIFRANPGGISGPTCFAASVYVTSSKEL